MSETGPIACDCEGDTARCAALDVDPIDYHLGAGLARGFKALGDPHRMAILHLLTAAAEPVCVVDIERHLPVGQSTVSYHLKTLLDAGVLEMERRCRWSYYTVRPDRLTELTDSLDRYIQRLSVGAN